MENETELKWKRIIESLKDHFGNKPDLNAVLFIIGMRELGVLPEKKFTKEQKIDLMHIATCRLLSISGYYRLKGVDPEGWPQWEKVIPVPPMSLLEQETMLRHHAVAYFEEEGLL